MFELYGDYPHVVSANFIESESGFLRAIFMHFGDWTLSVEAPLEALGILAIIEDFLGFF